ncbi:C1 family peptidase [Lactobacillus sp. ESL0701]|uniref:C1 family peptidase n=1 Tax=Lactobacillus sp. ESL0701 TaxID=2983217 RepID=UPI0023F740CA|nr:C1 family peptidase [Lactobacillus sp. ESL0701]MDF7671947.1 C1 family peptidase [Lactobacillus sp. ESL0701]
MNHQLSIQELAKYSADFNNDPQNQVIARAAQKSGIFAASYNEQKVSNDLNRVFSTELDVGQVTAQKHSGRCWEFAALNVLRHYFGKKYHIKDFTFSQSYNFFWDKIERANIFYNHIIATADQSLDSRTVRKYLASAGQDGGHWQLAASLVQKYGVVPSYAMPESFNSNNTDALQMALGKKLRKDALVLRQLKQAGKDEEVTQTQDRFLNEVYRMTAIAIGEPPKKFDLEYRDDDKKYHLDKDLTPQTFYQKYLGDLDLDDYVVLTNSPNHEYNKLYGFSADNNVAGLCEIKLLNVPMEYLATATIRQLKDGEAVWFGNDVLHELDRPKGYLDSELYQMNHLFDVDLKMSKADRLRTGEANFSHAMTFVGVDEDQGEVRRWKVENSWGDQVGKNGYFVMSNDWFNDYVYEVAVHKKYLTPEQLALAEGPIAEDLPVWDPLG